MLRSLVIAVAFGLAVHGTADVQDLGKRISKRAEERAEAKGAKASGAKVAVTDDQGKPVSSADSAAPDVSPADSQPQREPAGS